MTHAGPGSVEVVYVAGVQRSGSTLLANLLGEQQHFFVGGELANFWYLLYSDAPCGCGQPATQCPVWQRIVKRVGPADVEAIATALHLNFRSRFAPFLLGVPLLGARLAPRLLRPGGQHDPLESLYRAIAEESGARVVIDSSKSPGYLHLLAMRRRLDVRVLHLVRDPITNVPATMRRPHPDLPELRPSDTAFLRSVSWLLWHLSLHLVWGRHARRYLRVRYEDFVADPAGELGRVLDWIGVDAAPVIASGQRSTTLRGNHSVYGNPRQVRSGPVTVETQEQPVLGRGTARLIRTVTWPLRHRYYPAAK